MDRIRQNNVWNQVYQSINMLTIEDVIKLVRLERYYQDNKWGTSEERTQSLPGYLLVMRKELEEAERGWLKGGDGRNSCLAEMLQVAAVAVAALEEHGDYRALFNLYSDEAYEHLRRQGRSYIRDLERENEYLHDRLEDNRVYDAGGNMTRCEPGTVIDGIASRDEEIRLLKERIRKLESRDVSNPS